MAPPGLAWVQTAGHKLALSSRRGSFSMSPGADASPPAPLTLHVLTRLALLVEFLDENHRREEGLYRREGPQLEAQDLLEFCLSRDPPDLAAFSPHAIATVIKHCLLDRLEPLVPYAVSAQMLEAFDGTSEATQGLLLARFKQINAASREFLKLFLIHLHHLSITASCRMDAKSLASHVGVALIRPTEDKKRLASRIVKKQRELVAQFLIEQAAVLPYDCATEMELETIPDRPMTATKEDHHQSTATSCPLESTTGGQIGDSAQSEGAEEEEPLFIRCNDTQGQDQADPASTPANDQTQVADATSAFDASGPSSNRRGSIVVEDYESDASEAAPRHLLSPVASTTADASGIVNQVQPDIPAPTSSPILVVGACGIEDPLPHSTAHETSVAVERSAEPSEISDRVRPDSVRKLADDGTPPIFGLIKKKSGFMTEVRGILARRRSKPDAGQLDNLQRGDEDIRAKTTDLIKASDAVKNAATQTLKSVATEASTTEHDDPNQCEQSTQTPMPTPVQAVDGSTNTDEPVREDHSSVEHTAEELLPDVQQLVERKLKDIQTLLATADAALLGTPPLTETSRALHQLHTQALAMISDLLAVVNSSQDSDVDGGSGASSDNTFLQTNQQFLDFLEIQSKTQVNILEVEVKAGQELMRLLKAQHQQERTALEQEKATLRVTCTETERLSTELRSELRKCRNELACQAAFTTRLSREKRDVEERLATSETQRQAREVALVQAKEELAEMKKTQSRVQSCSIPIVAADNQREAATGQYASLQAALPSELKGDRTLDANAVLRAERFLTTAKQRSTSGMQHEQRRQQVKQRESSLEAFDRARSSYQEKATTTNAMALERLKRKMAKDIQEQIAATKRALEEMEDCGLGEGSSEADQGELRAMQGELQARTAVVDHTMNESRHQLSQLLSGSPSPPSTNLSSSNLYNLRADPVIEHRPWSSETAGLLHELAQLVDHEPESVEAQSDPRDSNNSTNFDSNCVDDWQELKAVRVPQRQREPQSQTYKRWVAQRSQKVAQLDSHRDRRSVEQALASMQTFKQTLAAMQADKASG